jgi:hypothetical protein
LLVVCVSLALPTAVNAQVAIGGVFGLSTRAAGADDRPYLGPGVGGTSLGSVIFVEVDVSQTVSLGSEFSKAGTISGAQEERVSAASKKFLTTHHDTVLYGVIKLKPRNTTGSHVVAVGGLGFARRQTERTGTLTSSIRPFTTTPVLETLSDTVPAATGGVDGVFPISRRAGILVVARVHYLADKDRGLQGIVYRGVSSLIFRYGIGLRVRF